MKAAVKWERVELCKIYQQERICWTTSVKIWLLLILDYEFRVGWHTQPLLLHARRWKASRETWTISFSQYSYTASCIKLSVDPIWFPANGLKIHRVFVHFGKWMSGLRKMGDEGNWKEVFGAAKKVLSAASATWPPLPGSYLERKDAQLEKEALGRIFGKWNENDMEILADK